MQLNVKNKEMASYILRWIHPALLRLDIFSLSEEGGALPALFLRLAQI